MQHLPRHEQNPVAQHCPGGQQPYGTLEMALKHAEVPDGQQMPSEQDVPLGQHAPLQHVSPPVQQLWLKCCTVPSVQAFVQCLVQLVSQGSQAVRQAGSSVPPEPFPPLGKAISIAPAWKSSAPPEVVEASQKEDVVTYVVDDL